MKMSNFCAALWLAAGLAPVARAAEEPAAQHYVGLAYAGASGKLRY